MRPTQSSTPCIAVVFALASWGDVRAVTGFNRVAAALVRTMCQVSMQRRFLIDCLKRTSSLIPSPPKHALDATNAAQHSSTPALVDTTRKVSQLLELHKLQPIDPHSVWNSTRESVICESNPKKSSTHACVLCPLLPHKCLSARLPKHRLVHHDVERVHQNPSGAKRVQLRRDFPPGDSCTYYFR